MKNNYLHFLLSHLFFPLLTYIALVLVGFIDNGQNSLNMAYIAEYVWILLLVYGKCGLIYFVPILFFEIIILKKRSLNISQILLLEFAVVSVAVLIFFIKYISIIIFIIWLSYCISQYLRWLILRSK